MDIKAELATRLAGHPLYSQEKITPCTPNSTTPLAAALGTSPSTALKRVSLLVT